MYCIRCKIAVKEVLEDNGIKYESIELGTVKLEEPLTSVEKERVKEGLKKYELELVEDRDKVLVEKIKAEIIKIMHSSQPMKFKLSAYLSQTLEYNYNYLANSFSELEGITLERYFISQRVERVKELIVYEDLSLTEISEELNYSSVSHLCLQFKKVTGLTPAEFRKEYRSGNFVWRPI